eukprot:jgi/Picre1/30884/NNA_006243.t1
MVNCRSGEDILNELTALVQDDMQIATYKYISKRFNIPFDASKSLLHAFLKAHEDDVEATYLLSGWTKGEKGKHVVKVVRGACLENEKESLSRIDALHVYSVQPKAYRGGHSLYEADMGPVEAVAGRPLGRVVMVVAPVRTKSGADSALPVPAKRAPSETKQEPVSTTGKAQQGKRKMQTIESDDEDGTGAPESTAKKYKTYINDKGEEVTEVENVKETSKAAEKKPTARSAENKGSKSSGKATKQKGIASFFSKKK